MPKFLTFNGIEDRACRIEKLPLSEWSEQTLWRAFWRGEFNQREMWWAAHEALVKIIDATNYVERNGQRTQIDCEPPPGMKIPDYEPLATGNADPRWVVWETYGEFIGLPTYTNGDPEAYLRQISDRSLSVLSTKQREFARCIVITPVGLILWCRDTGRDAPEFIQSINSDVARGYEEDGYECTSPRINLSKWNKRKPETQINYSRWFDNVPAAKKIWKQSNCRKPSLPELATEIAKLEKAGGNRQVTGANVRRRLDEYFPGWAD